MQNIELVILANSVKHHQHCVAGKNTANGQWIRPVSNTAGAELSHAQARCRNPYGSFDVRPLQKVIMSFTDHAPLPHQPENYVIDNSDWVQHYRIADHELSRYLDRPNDLWGTTDRIEYRSIVSGQIVIPQSLYLVMVDDLNLYMNQYNRRRAAFTYSGINYDLAVTDPNFDRITQNNQAVQGILCVSLGGEYQGSSFKIVATIL